MKTRIVIIVILLLVLTILLTRNDERITNTLLGVINPIKQNYQHFTQNLEDKSQSYLFQKESIEKLNKENLILRQRLLEQTHYIKQVKDIYNILPQLSKIPVRNISITDTISYVKLNSFSQIILTNPGGLKEGKLYGLIQNNVVAGTAQVHNRQLYGYLTSDEMCRFAVFIGKDKAPGIAIGFKENEMLVKFIPKWHKIKKGDFVVTNGLDDIFFSDIPVGIVTKIEVQSSYKVAHIKTYSDIFHPKTFFLVNDAKATLAEGFDANTTRLAVQYSASMDSKKEQNQTAAMQDTNQTLPAVSSIPSRIDQTQEDVIEPETPLEKIEAVKPKTPQTTVKEKPKNKNLQRSNSLDLF
ncbi:MAG: rod shape-determining protein MreC [Sulfurovum sp.]|jgi:rod shape-determining protein MreC|nr:rod shape-determining protein MreC [Sulfurovum sp.]